MDKEDFRLIAGISTFKARSKLWISIVSLQLLPLHIIIYWQKQYKVRGFIVV
jgi:hypothetical protein